MSRRLETSLAAGLILTLLSLAGCSGIPSEGGVEAGPIIGEELPGGVVFDPLGPEEGADQRSILEGFIKAFTGTQRDYAVARQFLSEDFRADWDPRRTVFIRTGGAFVTAVDDRTLDYTFTASGQLDESGAYRMGAAGSQTLSYGFVRENGEWRISGAPQGIVLPESTFRNLFTMHSVYFYDLSLRTLVPDQRWFPAGTSATRLVSALLAGPPDWLKGAVVTQFPEGTTLSQGTGVTVEGAVAQVDLSSQAASANQRQRQLMKLQLTSTLASVPEVADVRISVGGSRMMIDPLGADAPLVQHRVDPRPLLLTDDGFGYVAGGTLSPLDRLSANIVALEPRSVTLGQLGTVAAVGNDEGAWIVRGGNTAPLLADARPGLIDPSIDDFGYLWTVPADSPADLMVHDFAGVASAVDSSLSAGSRIIALEVARDSSRVAILLQSASGPRVIVAAIVRTAGEGFLPTGLGEAVMDVAVGSENALDLTWVDDYSVAVLTAGSDGQALVTQLMIGGAEVSLGRPGNGVAIVGGNGVPGLRVLGTDGVLSVPRGGSWQKTSMTAELIATQR